MVRLPTRRHFRWNTRLQRGSLLRYFSLFIVLTFFGLTIITSIISMIPTILNVSSSSITKWTSSISSEAYVSVIGMELPLVPVQARLSGNEIPRPTNVAMEMVTSLKFGDPRSLLRQEIPGLMHLEGEIIVAGEGVTESDIPMESSPPLDVLLAEREAIWEEMNGSDEQTEEYSQPSDDQSEQPEMTTDGREVVYIYHTHSQESWLPHIPSAEEANEAFHPEVNITLVGERLGEELERRGIGTYVDTTDITQKLVDEGLSYSLSYAKSRDVIEASLQDKEDITFMFDLHRDSVERDLTTIEIDGKKYARTYFVIGQRNPNYEKNAQFAEHFHDMIEERYPGLSKGVFVQPGGNGEYNQSISENNVLIEIGGVENTLEESYRTAEALADVIADMYWEVEKVDGEESSES